MTYLAHKPEYNKLEDDVIFTQNILNLILILIYNLVPSIYAPSKVSPSIGFKGFKKVLEKLKYPRVAVIKSFILSTGLSTVVALLI